MTTDSKNRIIGAIIGDIVGSTYEFAEKIPTKFKLFRSACSFTDDTVLTVAIADALLHGRSFADAIEDWGNRYIYAGFGHSFREWKKRRKNNPSATNNSKGNGCGMRVSPIGFWAKSIDEAMSLAKESAIITHNSPEGIAGAQAIATAVFMAKEQRGKEEIKQFVEKTFGYDLDLSYEEIWSKVNEYDNVNKLRREREWAENTCPVAIIAFLNSNSYEECVRTAISYGGDVDTIACMAGGIAAAYYGVPDEIIKEVAAYLPQDIIDIVNEFDGLELANRNTPAAFDRWAKRGHILVYGSGKEIAGKIALIDLWASWCGSCRRTSKSMIPLYEKYKERGFTVVGVARESKREDMERALARDGYPWLNLLELQDEHKIWEKYGVSRAGGITVLVDRDGTILAIHPTAEEVERILQEKL